MKERPILFSGEMVRAILDGRKTQTRRVVKPQPTHPDVISCYSINEVEGGWYPLNASCKCMSPFVRCPYGVPGDRLWVREAWASIPCYCCDDGHEDDPCTCTDPPKYRATDKLFRDDVKWKPSIHMPRWASRITLEVMGVRVERVQEINGEDIEAEGVRLKPTEMFPGINRASKLRRDFQLLWDSINGKRYPWESDPWVWIVEFKCLTRP